MRGDRAGEGARFVAAFEELKTVADSPDRLRDLWQNSTRIQQLCDELTRLVRGFENIEEIALVAITPHVSSAGVRARRDYDAYWRSTVEYVADRELNADLGRVLDEILEEMGASLDDNYIPVNDGGDRPAPDPLGTDIEDWKDEAREDVAALEWLIDEAWHHSQFDEDWAKAADGSRTWERLKSTGLNVVGALWRRRAIPHVLVPSHVANHYGKAPQSLYIRLRDAARAFMFGAPLAALALQRAVLEEVLTRHWGAGKGWIRDAHLPETTWDSRASRLKRLGDAALHRDLAELTREQLDRTIIENFLILRLLIERAPENLAAHREQHLG